MVTDFGAVVAVLCWWADARRLGGCSVSGLTGYFNHSGSLVGIGIGLMLHWAWLVL